MGPILHNFLLLDIRTFIFKGGYFQIQTEGIRFELIVDLELPLCEGLLRRGSRLLSACINHHLLFCALTGALSRALCILGSLK